jgi:alkanesulfonate monooxygenase SsuD/methylene tetrahydromethanopterin reductase-like flavin-dependent oxidoreductase (luciferase family)
MVEHDKRYEIADEYLRVLYKYVLLCQPRPESSVLS